MSQARNERTLQLLHRVVVPLDRLLQTSDREVGCSAAQLSALGVIIYLRATTLSALAAKERISSATASRIVEGLVRDGLVERTIDPDDRRAVCLSATEKGRVTVKTACDRRAEMLGMILDDLSEDEWAALSVSAKALNRIFGYDRVVEPAAM
ncbi:MAG: MarR family transcriptional regulator [Hyphomicrobiaceae bacterium]|nr:MarR family transcriptional regulator [Hyphomicrobiaceae bacterium]MCC0024366.1 MarR family transcriptional regulator [Hyphomicrobiaceae bacterium]